MMLNCALVQFASMLTQLFSSSEVMSDKTLIVSEAAIRQTAPTGMSTGPSFLAAKLA